MAHFYTRRGVIDIGINPLVIVMEGPKVRHHYHITAASAARALRVAANSDDMVFVPATYYLAAGITFRIDGTCPDT